ncbi:hypothetical protein DIPPA_16057 [Diplonema papillatum]|nr:hypothetical protein DIPPA_16057 [Diplonema papillatum]
MASCVLVALLVLSAEPWEVGPDRCYKESDFLGGFMGLYWPDPVVSRENAPARVKRMLDWKISGQDRAADEIAGIFARHATDPDASEGAPPVLHLHGPSNHGKTASMMAIAAALCKAAPRVNGHRKPCSYLCRVGGRAGDADAGRVEAEVAAHLHQYPRGSILFDDVNEARGKQRMLALIERMVTRQPVYAAGGTPVSTEKAQIIFTSDYGFTDSPEDNTASDVLSHKREVKADEEAKFGSHRVASRTRRRRSLLRPLRAPAEAPGRVPVLHPHRGQLQARPSPSHQKLGGSAGAVGHAERPGNLRAAGHFRQAKTLCCRTRRPR